MELLPSTRIAPLRCGLLLVCVSSAFGSFESAVSPLSEPVWKCMNGTNGASDGNVTVDGLVMMNATVYNFTQGFNGCAACSCCLDYVTDCQGCVSTCRADTTASDVKDRTHFACVQQPSHGGGRPRPGPIQCQVMPGEYDHCKNDPLLPLTSRQFNNSLCLFEGSSQCGPKPPPDLGVPLPGELGAPWPFKHVCTAAVAANGLPRCTVCGRCCRDNVIDCEKCVKAECPPSGDRFYCQGGSCAQLQLPVNVPGGYSGAVFDNPNCTDSSGKAACGAPFVPVPGNKFFGCYGSQCLKVSNLSVSNFDNPSCNGTCGLKPPTPPAPPRPPAPPAMVGYSLATVDPKAVCLNGDPASVQAFTTMSTDWVILLGSVSAELNFCVDNESCARMGRIPTRPGFSPPPPAAPPNVSLTAGPQSRDCSNNPDWCNANHAQIDLCDFSFFMGNQTATAQGCILPGTCCAEPVMTFAGRQVLTAALKRLAQLGLNKATSVMLTGVGFGGTSVILNADFIGEQLMSLAPNLDRYKALPVDALHPKLSDAMASSCNCSAPMPWMTDALFNLDQMSGASKLASDGCKKKNSANQSNCLYASEALPFVKTPLFAVQQMPSVWDSQCIMDGLVNSNSILQITCSQRGALYTCAQYPDLCDPNIVGSYYVPVQTKMIADANQSGLPTRAGFGGFFHSCYLGSYFFNNYAKTGKPVNGIWNEIAINGVTMQAAISAWWKDQVDAEAGGSKAGTFWHQDGLWDPKAVPPTPPEGINLDRDRSDAPTVPWYTSRFMTNPTCRGYPWY